MLFRIKKSILYLCWALCLSISFYSSLNCTTTIPSGLIIPWPSTAASIPSGWTRETNLDTYYIQGAGAGADADLSTALGSTTHIHTLADHLHIQNSHQHVLSGGAGSASNITDGSGIDLRPIVTPTHTHPTNVTSNSATATNQNASVTLNTASNDPPYIKVIWIKSDGTPTGIPSNAYAFFSSDTLPTSWTRVQGNKFLKGADAAGDGGGTGGASDSHTHTETATHNHIQNAHLHSPKASGTASGTSVGISTAGGTDLTNTSHTHSVSLANTTATNQAASISLGNSDGQPVFKKLNVINNGTGGTDYPSDIIGLWGGTNANIPTDFERFASMDGNFLKGANADGESNVTTGGSQTHTHTEASGHTHIQDTHNHTGSAGNPSTARTQSSPFDTTVGHYTHIHTWTIGNTVAVNQANALTTASNTSESAYPPYKKVIFIKTAGGVKRVIESPGIIISLASSLIFGATLRRI